VGNRLDVNAGSWLGSTAPTVGQKTMANSLPVAIASDQSGVPVTFAGNGTVFSNQAAVTATAAALATNAAKSVCVKALVGNTLNVYLGVSGVTTSTGMELAPGDSVCLNISNSNLVYHIASSTGSSVSFIGTN